MRAKIPDPDRETAARRELFAVLAHEFRSPIGAILGFEELLSEGILGEVPAPAQDALARIRSSALQLLDLVAGLNDLSIAGTGQSPLTSPATVELQALLDRVLEALATEAAGRGTSVQLQVEEPPPPVTTDAERMERALQLALMAAVKTSAGGTITLRARVSDGAVEFLVAAPGLDVQRDEPDLSLHAEHGPRLSGAGLRIAMARQALRPLGGEITLEPAPTGAHLRLRLPLQPGD